MIKKVIAGILLLGMAAFPVAALGAAGQETLPYGAPSTGMASPDAKVEIQSISYALMNISENRVSHHAVNMSGPAPIEVHAWDTILFTAKGKYTGPAGTKGMMIVYDSSDDPMIWGTELSPGVVTKMKVQKPFAFLSGTHKVRFVASGGGKGHFMEVTILVVV